jgi:hypothetical protein
MFSRLLSEKSFKWFSIKLKRKLSNFFLLHDLVIAILHLQRWEDNRKWFIWSCLQSNHCWNWRDSRYQEGLLGQTVQKSWINNLEDASSSKLRRNETVFLHKWRQTWRSLSQCSNGLHLGYSLPCDEKLLEDEIDGTQSSCKAVQLSVVAFNCIHSC